MEILRKWAKPALSAICAIFLGFMGLFPVVSYYGAGVDAFYLIGYSDTLCIILGVFAIIGSLMGVISLIVIGYNIYAKKDKYTFIPVTACILSLIFMVLGIVKVEGLPTLVFVPFIIIAIMTICYTLCAKLLPASESVVVKGEKAIKSSSVVAQKSSIELIKEYKELLDSGIITQEEFDAKKAQLL